MIMTETVTLFSLLLVEMCLALMLVTNSRKTIVIDRIEDTASPEEKGNTSMPDISATQGAPAPIPEKRPEEEDLPSPAIRRESVLGADPFTVLALSIQGRGHLLDNIPCQDYHLIESVGDKMLLVVVSDGAGSKANADSGSRIVCERFAHHLKDAVLKLQWSKDHLPDEPVWDGVFRKVVELIQRDLAIYAEENDGVSFSSLAATLTALLITPKKIFSGHVGDGRAGILTSDGWVDVITPHKGSEAHQTVFVTNKILDPGFTVSDVPVPETRIINATALAFVAMSDGCENGLWKTQRKEDLPDGDYRYISMNEPFAPALNHIIGLLSAHDDDQQRKDLFLTIIDRYNRPLKNEKDDKTLCIGFMPSATDNNKK